MAKSKIEKIATLKKLLYEKYSGMPTEVMIHLLVNRYLVQRFVKDSSQYDEAHIVSHGNWVL